MKKFLLCIFAWCMAMPVLAQTPIPAGNVSGTWSLDGSPYLIEGDITILSGQQLTVDPGVWIEFQGYYALYVQGSLLAEGTENETIMITIHDSTGWHNMNITDGGWHGFRFGYSAASSDSSRISYCTFAFGKAIGSNDLDKHGGAIGVYQYPDLAVSNCIFYRNAAQETGGAIAVNSVPVNLQQNSFWNCKAYNGGAVSLSYSSSHIYNNVFVDNHAENSGGAIVMYMNCNPDINTNLLAGNFADYGGGIQVEINCNPILRNNLIYSNVAYVEGGGVDLEGNCQALFINNTIVENFALFGGGIDVEVNTSPTFLNCIIWGNTAFVDGPQIHLFSEDSDPHFYYCDIKGGIDSIGTMYNSTTYLNYTGTYENNIDLDPDFYILGDFRYLLNDGSPCIDAGDPDPQYNDLEDPDNPGFALFPSKGALRNDMGVYGGPYAPEYVIMTGIEDPVQPGSEGIFLSLYPNPCSGPFTIRFNIQDAGPRIIGIFTIAGKKIYETETNEREIKLDVRNLPNGMYFVKVQVGDEIAVKKLIVN
jgi:hypothetical protein